MTLILYHNRRQHSTEYCLLYALPTPPGRHVQRSSVEITHLQHVSVELILATLFLPPQHSPLIN